MSLCRPTPAPTDSGSAADGTLPFCPDYPMLAERSAYPCRCPLSQTVGRLAQPQEENISEKL